MSINFRPMEGGKYECELNNATEENQFATALYTMRNYTYLAIEVKLFIDLRRFV